MIHDRAILDGLPRLHDVRMLWFNDWYDGPVDGLAEYMDREYWFADIDDYQGTWPQRRYVLHPISAEQAAAEWALHRECQARTGLAGCCHEPACPGPVDGAADLESWWRDHPEPHNPDYVATLRSAGSPRPVKVAATGSSLPDFGSAADANWHRHRWP